MGNMFFVAACIMVALLIALTTSPKSDSDRVSDADIMKARIISSNNDTRIANLNKNLPSCKNDKQCIYNVYMFNGFDYSDVISHNGALVLSSSAMKEIKKVKDLSMTPLTSEMGLQINE